MRIKSPLLTVLFFLFLSLAKVYSDDGEISYRLNSYLFSEFLINSLPGAFFYPSFFENFVPDATFMIEETNGFSFIDPPRAYYEGDSFIHFNWFYEGFNINSTLDEGSPAVVLPLSFPTQYELRGETPFSKDYGLNFVRAPWGKSFSQINVSTVYSSLGSFVSWAKYMVKPHASTSERNALLYSKRRKILSNYSLDYVSYKRFKNSTFSFSLTYFDIQRQFNDFNLFNTIFEEDGKFILLGSKYEKEYRDGFLYLTGIFNSLRRDHAWAELGRYPQETQKKEKHSFFSGMRLKKKDFTLAFSYLYEREELEPSSPNFPKDQKDIDGEGNFPFERWGLFSGNVLRLSVDVPVLAARNKKKTGIDIFADLKSTYLRGSENAFDFNSISFGGLPYLVVLWTRGREYQNSNLNLRTGAMANWKPNANLSLHAKLILQYSSLRFDSRENNLHFLAPGYDLGIVLFRNPEVLFSYGQTPYELRENVNFFLEKSRPWGTIYRWDDDNGNFQYQNGEEGEIFGYTGGKFHSVDEELRLPSKKRYLLSISTRLSKKFCLNIKGLFKRISNNFWIRFKEDYGFYERIGNSDIYFFAEPFKDYVLSNYEFEKDPFYAQLLLHIHSTENKRWFFSFSFLAHIGMGYTAFGNGPGTNDIGILDESQANPNAWTNGYGRVDGDRAYVGKMFFGFYLAKNLFFAASLKYRDGTPFAFFNTLLLHDQWVISYRTIKAENERGIKGGPREDYVSDVSLKIKYNFKLFDWDAEAHLSLFNVFDFGSELSEYVFSGGARLANELQIPRSARLGLAIKL